MVNHVLITHDGITKAVTPSLYSVANFTFNEFEKLAAEPLYDLKNLSADDYEKRIQRGITLENVFQNLAKEDYGYFYNILLQGLNSDNNSVAENAAICTRFFVLSGAPFNQTTALLKRGIHSNSFYVQRETIDLVLPLFAHHDNAEVTIPLIRHVLFNQKFKDLKDTFFKPGCFPYFCFRRYINPTLTEALHADKYLRNLAVGGLRHMASDNLSVYSALEIAKDVFKGKDLELKFLMAKHVLPIAIKNYPTHAQKYIEEAIIDCSEFRGSRLSRDWEKMKHAALVKKLNRVKKALPAATERFKAAERHRIEHPECYW